MGSSTISLGLGLGGGKSATSSGSPGGGGAFANVLSLNFDGTNDALDLGATFQSTFTSAFSVSLWYKQDSATGARTLFGVRKAATDVVTAYINANAIFVWYEANNRKQQSSFPETSDTNWHHFCVTVQQDGLYVDVKLYLDGVYRKLIRGGGAIADYTNTANLFIGARNYADGTIDSYFSGLIDEVGIFSTALSDDGISIDADAGGVIAEIYNDGVPTTMPTDDLVSNYRMGDGIGDTESGGGAPANGDSVGTIVDQGDGGNNGTQSTASARPTFSSTVPS